MPVIHVEARLIRMTHTVPHLGQWLLIHHDDTYGVLDHAEAMALQRRASVSPSSAKPLPPSPPSPPVRSRHAVAVNGTAVEVQPRLLSILRLVAKTGPATVADVARTISSASSGLSAAKRLGFLEGCRAGPDSPVFIYDLTNAGRAIVNAAG